MKLKYLLRALLILVPLSVFSQESLAEFKSRSEPYYHYLKDPGISNFSCLFTSSAFINFVKDKTDSTHYYPLKLLWTREGNLYFILQPLPDELTESGRREYLQAAQSLKKLFRGIYYDWYKFALASPFADIPDSARLDWAGDTVAIRYEIKEPKITARVIRTFTRSGQLFKEIWLAANLKIVNYPAYQIVEGRWLCTGWDTQIYQNGEIKSGMAIQLRLRKVQGYWLPDQFDILAQSSSKPEEQVLTSLYLMNYLFNEKIEQLPLPKSSPESN